MTMNESKPKQTQDYDNNQGRNSEARTNIINILYDLSFMLPLCLVVILSGFTYAGVGGMTTGATAGGVATTGGIGGTAMAIVVLARILRYTERRRRTLIIGVLAMILGGLLLAMGRETRSRLFQEYSIWGWIPVVAVLCIIVGILLTRYFRFKIVVAAGLVGNAIYMMWFRFEISQIFMAATVLTLLVLTVAMVQKCWVKSGYTDMKAHIVHLAPVLLLIFVLLCMVPSPSEKFDWTFAKNIWNTIVTEYKRLSARWKEEEDEFSAFSGFSENSSFGGEIDTSTKEIMVLHTDGKTTGSLYMAGAVFEDFTVQGWESDRSAEGFTVDKNRGKGSESSRGNGSESSRGNESDSSRGNESESSRGNGSEVSWGNPADIYRQLDVLETRIAVSENAVLPAVDYIQNEDIVVENRTMGTGHVFLPGKTDLAGLKTSLPTSKLQYGDSYGISYSRLNRANPELGNLIDSVKPIEAEQWNTLLSRSGLEDKAELSYKNYQNYVSKIYEEYSETSGLSPKLAEIVEMVTEDATGDYSRLQTLANYLQTFEYNTHPGAIPESVTKASEYLDYLMLDTQSGFCVHYATAMVLLARECGYPARYVQGYYVVQKSGATEILVTEQNAHSWAEVYIDNFGWVIFEATPGYGVSGGWSINRIAAPTTQAAPDEDLEKQGENPEEEREPIPMRFFLIPLGLALGFGFIFLLIIRLQARIRFRRMDNEGKVRFLIAKQLRVLKLLGYPLAQNETLEEFRTRIVDAEIEKAKTKADKTALSSLQLYEKLLYSTVNVTDKDVQLVSQELETLKKALRGRGLRYWFYIL